MNAVIFGTGEYVTGWTGAEGSKSDKSLGVVALVHFDLRERGLIGDKILCVEPTGTSLNRSGTISRRRLSSATFQTWNLNSFPKQER